MLLLDEPPPPPPPPLPLLLSTSLGFSRCVRVLGGSPCFPTFDAHERKKKKDEKVTLQKGLISTIMTEITLIVK